MLWVSMAASTVPDTGWNSPAGLGSGCLLNPLKTFITTKAQAVTKASNSVGLYWAQLCYVCEASQVMLACSQVWGHMLESAKSSWDTGREAEACEEVRTSAIRGCPQLAEVLTSGWLLHPHSSFLQNAHVKRTENTPHWDCWVSYSKSPSGHMPTWPRCV